MINSFSPLAFLYVGMRNENNVKVCADRREFYITLATVSPTREWHWNLFLENKYRASRRAYLNSGWNTWSEALSSKDKQRNKQTSNNNSQDLILTLNSQVQTVPRFCRDTSSAILWISFTRLLIHAKSVTIFPKSRRRCSRLFSSSRPGFWGEGRSLGTREEPVADGSHAIP